MIDLVGLFDKIQIDYKKSGKNVSKGWLEIACPFPQCSDPGYHMGINLKRGSFHCWICGQKGSLITLLTKGLKIPYYQVKNLLQEFGDDEIYIPEKRKEIEFHNILPAEATEVLPEPHKQYLINRGFDPTTIQKKYHVKACYTLGNYSYRLLIPVIKEGIVVNFTGRDISGIQKERYKTCPNEKALIPMKECIYNIDTVKKGGQVIICEGAFDAWRMGDGAVATMGMEVTPAQIALLSNKKPFKAYILFDRNTLKTSEKLANLMSLIGSKAEILCINKKDPAELTDEEAKNIRKEINFEEG